MGGEEGTEKLLPGHPFPRLCRFPLVELGQAVSSLHVSR